VASAIALTFSPQSKTLFTYERPVKSDGTDVHKNVRAWDVQSGEEVTSWHHKNQDDWYVPRHDHVHRILISRIPSIDLTETYRLLPTSSDLLIYSPPFAPRPSLRLKADAPIKGIFLSKPVALPEGTTSAKPAPANAEAAVAVWIGEKKGAPGSVRLYPISQLVGKLASDGEKTENRDLPVAVARKAFYKADKLTVKWNNAGTMVCLSSWLEVPS
jgi:translation initiation factor 2A